MKINLLFFIIVALISATTSLQAQQIIHSTTTGGYWIDNSTWIEAIPGTLDSAVLQGPVVLGYGYSGFCNSLNITSAGSFGAYESSGSGNLFISGSMRNDGDIIGKNVYYLQGNLVNNKPWRGADNRIVFSGMDHSITCAPGAKLNAQLEANDSLQNFFLISDVTIDTNCVSDLGFSHLNAGNHKLNYAQGGFTNCRVYSLDTLQFDSWVSNLELDGDYKLKGNMTGYLNVCFYGQAINYGNIYFLPGVGVDPLRLKGDFINKGTVAHTLVQVEKNVANYGTWQTENTEFTGTGDKHISKSEGHPYGGTQFTSENSGSKIFLDSDVEFTVPSFHLNNNTLNCGNHKLTANTTFFDGTIQSESEIAGNNDFWASTFTGDFKLTGNNRFSNCIVNGNLENTGMMKDITFYGGTFKSYQHLFNRNSIQFLNLKIYGNLTNYGTIDNNSIVDVTGSSTQYINMTQSIESQVNFYSDITGTSYQWMKNGQDILNAGSIFLNFASLQLSDAGTYKCRVVTAGGETVFSREVIVNNTTSVAENEVITRFQVYPNPFFGHAILKWEQNAISEVRIDISDVSGNLIRTISQSVYPAGKNEVEFVADSRMCPGNYFLRIIAEGKTKNLKLNYSR